MHSNEAESRLRTLLAEAGLDPARLDPAETWRVFQAFAGESVVDIEDGDDLLLFQCGFFDWHDGKGLRFNWDFTRQFSFYDTDGEYDHMEQLSCTLFFNASDVPPGTASGIWSGDDLAEWVAAVESDVGFKAVLALTPVASWIEQSEV